MGKTAISMVIFHSYVKLPEGVAFHGEPDDPDDSWFISGWRKLSGGLSVFWR